MNKNNSNIFFFGRLFSKENGHTQKSSIFGRPFEKTKGQVSTEFLILLIMGVFIILTFIVIVQKLSDEKLEGKALNELDDLGKSIQQELLLATQLEDGYSREIYIPPKLYGIVYIMNLSNASSTIMYLNFYFEGTELFYAVPYLQGDVKTGLNTIAKQNGTISVTQ